MWHWPEHCKLCCFCRLPLSYEVVHRDAFLLCLQQVLAYSTC